MSFRPADIKDTTLLFRWRLESELEGKEGGWYEGSETTFDGHRVWFIRNIGRIRVWEENSHPAGMVRVESNGELSFFVPRHRRASGVAVRMLIATLELAGEFGGRLKATVDEGNTEMWKALVDAGFCESPVRFFTYKVPVDSTVL